MPAQVIDADGHVIEPEEMFASIDPEYCKRRPVAVTLPPDTEFGPSDKVWLVEGKIMPNIGGRGPTGRTTFFLPGSKLGKISQASEGDQTLTDIPARLQGMDRFQVDQQVVYPTMFLASIAEDPKLEAALFRCYNDWMARAGDESGKRVRWMAVIPFRDPELGVQEVRRVSQMGAAGVFTMGIIWEKQLSDPSFFPIYEAMSEEDLPLGVHLGWGSPKVTEVFTDSNSFFTSATIPVIWGFTYIMAHGLLGRFPKLRVGFIESGSEWVPYTINQLRRRYRPPTVLRKPGSLKPGSLGGTSIEEDLYRDPVDWFKEGRAFVACEPEEDLPYLINHIGEDGLMLSSDYPHGDPSADEPYVEKIAARTDVPERAKQKMLGENAARFYRL
ncbi:MAG TPA: amidohydrolase family protein [Chloroflexota bacterium]|nr:amidohydrolase family protein [Chloroflexota bacterium]